VTKPAPNNRGCRKHEETHRMATGIAGTQFARVVVEQIGKTGDGYVLVDLR